MILRTLLLGSLLLWHGVSWATDYYFSSSGSNSNPCTEAQPCQTTAHAETLSLVAGDRILFKRGETFTANTTFDILWSGSSGTPITLGAYGSGARPHITSGVPTTSNSFGLQCSGRQHLQVENLRFSGWLKGVWINGCSNLTLDNLEVDTIRGECVRFFAASSTITLEDSIVHDCGTALGNGEGLYIGTDTSADGGVPDVVQNVVIQNTEIYNTLHEPIDIKAGTRNVSVVNNVIHDATPGTSFGAGINVVGPHPNAATINSNHLIQGNRVTGMTGSFGRGIYCRPGCRIYQNTLDNNSQQGIFIERVYGPSQPTFVYNNTIVDHAGAAIQIQPSATSDVTSTNNLARGNASGNTASDPLFVNQAASDYRLCTGANQPVSGCAGRSPAIDAGVNVGLPFTGAAPDLGALEALPDITTGLVMHLKFDEGENTTAEDSTANNHDGTLDTGASWGAAKIGANSVALDGTADGTVSVSGLLGSPATISLTAWVNVAAFPTTEGTVLSLGDRVAVEVHATNPRAFFYNGTTWTIATASFAWPLNTWVHMAYTAQAGSQRLYLNGIQVAATNNGSPIVYTGGGADTILGQHGNVANTRRFQGLIDDLRVYSRVVSPADIAALVVYTEPPPLRVLITAPTSDATTSTMTTPLTTLGGNVTGPEAIATVTWTCPTCTPTSGTATCVSCTAAGGAGTPPVSWTVTSIGLAPGVNPLTVTATDATAATDPDTLTVTYAVPPASGCTHYASQSGGGNGMSEGSPFTVASFWGQAAPGKTLCMVDGTYTGGNSRITPPAGLSGSASLPITVRALNDGAVLIDGENTAIPVSLATTNDWFVLEGLNARNGTTDVYKLFGDNFVGRRLIGWNGTSGQANARVFNLRGLNSVVEDCAGWGDNARVILGGSDSTVATGGGYRRCFFEYNDHPTGTLVSGKGLLSGNGQRYENIIGTVNVTGADGG